MFVFEVVGPAKSERRERPVECRKAYIALRLKSGFMSMISPTTLLGWRPLGWGHRY